mmetsp:Transcript_30724/g.70831  ORF Transcript_30724/g.70831 Transcript_30724/m.70831 type:complete len:202 (-) Transcript_30724:30-635(-)
MYTKFMVRSPSLPAEHDAKEHWHGRLNALPEVLLGIAEHQVVLMEVSLGGRTRRLVRGDPQSSSQDKVFENATKDLQLEGFTTKLVSGGRVKNEPTRRRMEVSGFPGHYHREVVRMIQNSFPRFIISSTEPSVLPDATSDMDVYVKGANTKSEYCSAYITTSVLPEVPPYRESGPVVVCNVPKKTLFQTRHQRRYSPCCDD